jgi:hypothetical protein
VRPLGIGTARFRLLPQPGGCNGDAQRVPLPRGVVLPHTTCRRTITALSALKPASRTLPIGATYNRHFVIFDLFRSCTGGRLDRNPVFCPWMRFGGSGVPNYPSTASSLSTALKIEKQGGFQGQEPRPPGLPLEAPPVFRKKQRVRSRQAAPVYPFKIKNRVAPGFRKYFLNGYYPHFQSEKITLWQILMISDNIAIQMNRN